MENKIIDDQNRDRDTKKPRSTFGCVATFQLHSSHGNHPVVYLNSGSFLSPSLVPPGSITFLSANFSVS
jgi:hypothetical protein